MSDTGDLTARLGIDASVTGADSVTGLAQNVASLSQQLLQLSQGAIRQASVQDQLSKALDRTKLSTSLARTALHDYRQSAALTNTVIRQTEKHLIALDAAQRKVAASGGMTTAIQKSYAQTNTHLNSMIASSSKLEKVMKGNAIESYGNKISKAGIAAQRSSYYMAAAVTAPILQAFRTAFFNYTKLEREQVRLTKLISDGFGTGAEAIGLARKEMEKMNVPLDKITRTFGVSRILVQGLAGDFAELGVSTAFFTNLDGEVSNAITELVDLTVKLEKLGNLDIGQSQAFIQSVYQNILRVRRDLATQGGYTLDLTDADTMQKIIAELTGQLAIFNLVENKTTLSLKDIADAFPEVSAAATTFGLSMSETTALLAPMVAAGYQVGASANSIKVSLQRMVAMTKQNTGIIQGLNQALGDDFQYAAGVGMENIQMLVDGFNSLLSIKGEQGTLELFSRLFGVRQGPRMETSIRQLAAFQTELDKVGSAERTIANELENKVNQRLKAYGYEGVSLKKIVDLSNLHRMATKEVNGEYTQQAKLVQEGQKDAAKTLQGVYADTSDFIAKVGTEAGKIFFMEAMGGASFAGVQMERELNAAIDTAAIRFDKLREALLGIGRAIIPVVDSVVKLILPLFQKVEDFLKSLGPGTRKALGFLVFAALLIPQFKIIMATMKVLFGGAISGFGKMIFGANGLRSSLMGVKAVTVSLQDILTNPKITRGYNKLTQYTDDTFLLEQKRDAPGYRKGILNRRKMVPDTSGVSLPVRELLENSGMADPSGKKSVKSILGASSRLGLKNTEELIDSMLRDMGAIPAKIADASTKATESTAKSIAKSLKGTIFQNNTFIGNKFGGNTPGPGRGGTTPGSSGGRTPKTPATGGTPMVPASTVPTVPTPSAPASPPVVPLSPSKGVTSLPGFTAPTAATLGRAATIGAPIMATAERMAAEAKEELDALNTVVQEEVVKASEVVKEATKPRGTSPRGSPARAAAAVEKTVGDAVSTATAPIKGTVDAVTGASADLPSIISREIEKVIPTTSTPSQPLGRVMTRNAEGKLVVATKEQAQEILAERQIELDKQAARFAQERADLQNILDQELAAEEQKIKDAFERAQAKKEGEGRTSKRRLRTPVAPKPGLTSKDRQRAMELAQSTKDRLLQSIVVPSSITPKQLATHGAGKQVMLSYKEITGWFDEAGQALPDEYEFMRQIDRQMEMTMASKKSIEEEIKRNIKQKSPNPFGTIRRRFVAFDRASDQALKSSRQKSLRDSGFFQTLLTDRQSQLPSTSSESQIISEIMGDLKTAGGGQSAPTSSARLGKATRGKIQSSKIKSYFSDDVIPPPGVEQIQGPANANVIKKLQDDLDAAKKAFDAPIQQKDLIGSSVKKVRKKQKLVVESARESLDRALGLNTERFIPATPATTSLLNLQSRDDLLAQSRGQNIPDNKQSFSRVLSNAAQGMDATGLDPKVRVLYETNLQKQIDSLRTTKDKVLKEIIQKEFAGLQSEFLRYEGGTKISATQNKKLMDEALRNVAQRKGLDSIQEFNPLSTDFNPGAEKALLSNKKAVDATKKMFKNMGDSGKIFAGHLNEMVKDVSPAATAARSKALSQFKKMRDKLPAVSGGMGAIGKEMQSLRDIVNKSIDDFVNQLPKSFGPNKKAIIRQVAQATVGATPGAGKGPALDAAIKLMGQEVDSATAKSIKSRLDDTIKDLLISIKQTPQLGSGSNSPGQVARKKLRRLFSDPKFLVKNIINNHTKLVKSLSDVLTDALASGTYAIAEAQKGVDGLFKKAGGLTGTVDQNALVEMGNAVQKKRMEKAEEADTSQQRGTGTTQQPRAAARAAEKEAKRLESNRLLDELEAGRSGSAATELNTGAKGENTAATKAGTAATTDNTVAERTDTASTTELAGAKKGLTAATARGTTTATVDEQITKALGQTKVAQIAKLESQIAAMTAEQLASESGLKVQNAQKDLRTKLNTLAKAQAKVAAAQAGADASGRKVTTVLTEAKQKLATAISNAKTATDKLNKAVTAATTKVAESVSDIKPKPDLKPKPDPTPDPKIGPAAPAIPSAAPAAPKINIKDLKGIVPDTDSGSSRIVKAVKETAVSFDKSLANFFKGPNFFQGPNIFQGKLITADKLKFNITDRAKDASSLAKARGGLLDPDDPRVSMVKQSMARKEFVRRKGRIEGRIGKPLTDDQLENLAKKAGYNLPKSFKAKPPAPFFPTPTGARVPFFPTPTGAKIPKTPVEKITKALDTLQTKVSSVSNAITSKLTGAMSSAFKGATSAAAGLGSAYAKAGGGFIASNLNLAASSLGILAEGYRTSSTAALKFSKMSLAASRAADKLGFSGKLTSSVIKDLGFAFGKVGSLLASTTNAEFKTFLSTLQRSKVTKAWTFMLTAGMITFVKSLKSAIMYLNIFSNTRGRIEAMRAAIATLPAGVSRFRKSLVGLAAFTQIGAALKAGFGGILKTIFSVLAIAIKLNAAMLLFAPIVIVIGAIFFQLKRGVTDNSKAIAILKEGVILIKGAFYALANPIMDIINAYGGFTKATDQSGKTAGVIYTLARAFRAVAKAFNDFARGTGASFMKNTLGPVVIRLVNRFILLGRAIKGMFSGSASASNNFKAFLLSLLYEVLAFASKMLGHMETLLPHLGGVIGAIIGGVAKATIKMLQFLGGYAQEIAILFGSLIAGIGLALSPFTAGASLGIAAVGGSLIAAGLAGEMVGKKLAKSSGDIDKWASGVGQSIANGLGSVAGSVNNKVKEGMANIDKSYAKKIGRGINKVLADGTADPDGIKKAIDESLKKNAPAATAGGEALGSAIAKGMKKKLLEVKEDFTGRFFSRADAGVDRYIDTLKRGLDDQKDKALEAFDAQIDAIGQLADAEERLTAKIEYEEKRREMIRTKALDRENYLRERKVASYEGRTEDVRSLDLSFQKTERDSNKELKDFDLERVKTQQSEQREKAIDVINKEKDLLVKQYEQMFRDFDKQIEDIKTVGFSTEEEFKTLLSRLGVASQGFSDEIASTFDAAMNSLPMSINEVSDRSIGMFSTSMDKLVDEAKLKFGAANGTANATSILGAAYMLATGMPDAFKTAFNDGIIAQYVTPWSSKVTASIAGIIPRDLWVEAAGFALVEMVNELKRRLVALKGTLWAEFKAIFAAMPEADFERVFGGAFADLENIKTMMTGLFAEIVSIAAEINTIEISREKADGGGEGAAKGSTDGIAPGESMGNRDPKYGEHLVRRPLIPKVAIEGGDEKSGGGFFSSIADGAKNLADMLGPVKTAILGAVGAIAGFFALQTLFGIIQTAFAYIIWFIAGLATASAAVALTVGVIIGVLIYLYIKVKGFRDFVNNVFTKAWEILGTVVTGVFDGVMLTINGVWDSIKAIGQNILDFMKEIWGAIGGIVKDTFNKIVSFFVDGYNALKDNFANLASSIWNAFSGVAGALFDGIKEILSPIMELVGKIAAGIGIAIGIIVGAVMAVVGGVVVVIVNIFNAIKGPLFSVIGFVMDVIAKIFDIVGPVLEFVIDMVAKAISAPFKLINGVIDLVIGMVSGISGVIIPIGSIILDVLLAPFKLLIDVFKKIAENPIVDWVARFVAMLALVAAVIATWGVKLSLETIWFMIQKVVDIMSSLAKIVIDVVGTAFRFVKDLVLGVWDAIYSKVTGFIDWWHENVGSLWLILLAGVVVAYEAVRWLFNWMKDTFGPILAKVWDGFKDAVGVVWDLLKQVGSWIGSAFSAAWDMLKKAASLFWDYLGGAIDFAWGIMKTVASWIGTAFGAAWDVLKKAASLYWDYL